MIHHNDPSPQIQSQSLTEEQYQKLVQEYLSKLKKIREEKANKYDALALHWGSVDLPDFFRVKIWKKVADYIRQGYPEDFVVKWSHQTIKEREILTKDFPNRLKRNIEKSYNMSFKDLKSALKYHKDQKIKAKLLKKSLESKYQTSFKDLKTAIDFHSQHISKLKTQVLNSSSSILKHGLRLSVGLGSRNFKYSSSGLVSSNVKKGYSGSQKRDAFEKELKRFRKRESRMIDYSDFLNVGPLKGDSLFKRSFRSFVSNLSIMPTYWLSAGQTLGYIGNKLYLTGLALYYPKYRPYVASEYLHSFSKAKRSLSSSFKDPVFLSGLAGSLILPLGFKFLKPLYYKLGSEYISPEKVFSVDVLSGRSQFPYSSGPRETIKFFKDTYKDGYLFGYHATTSKFDRFFEVSESIYIPIIM
jgi:hypothetical protein